MLVAARVTAQVATSDPAAAVLTDRSAAMAGSSPAGDSSIVTEAKAATVRAARVRRGGAGAGAGAGVQGGTAVSHVMPGMLDLDAGVKVKHADR
jgi:hypothetical protein